ncbi:Zinc finger CCCH domain-containing protein 11 [Apostasia shenzhenica]|uniref:Zinc finger CCCH domain-containing protein 11 n=1 Tax=Apostasia shenzhenica TaxID=1088818 RepID=A0A2I0B4D1_9ASPA|nr:Zinc finger CCCH domain-containing protein 11 [Apostasia shenzhenica]
MPPKQQSKAELAKKQKIVEDKTFGLKNKSKSKNVQKYVQSLQQAVQPKPDASKMAAKAMMSSLFVKKKEEEKTREKELNDLFKVAVSQAKVPVGVDPKSILCEFFKAGQCAKGFKCKFSHDLNVQRKGEKIDIYSDKRDQERDVMEVVGNPLLGIVRKDGLNSFKWGLGITVCKYFLETVEKKQYGWFWVCPNGGKDCHYRHALPPGYILKSQMKALLDEETEKISIEEEIEDQRTLGSCIYAAEARALMGCEESAEMGIVILYHGLRAKVPTSTPMTPELFQEWKRKKMAEKEVALSATQAERAKNDRMSGRELFLSDASLFVDDAEAYEKYHREEFDDLDMVKKIDDQDGQPDEPSSSKADHDESMLADDDEEDDDDLDIDELNELEANLSKAALSIRESAFG